MNNYKTEQNYKEEDVLQLVREFTSNFHQLLSIVQPDELLHFQIDWSEVRCWFKKAREYIRSVSLNLEKDSSWGNGYKEIGDTKVIWDGLCRNGGIESSRLRFLSLHSQLPIIAKKYYIRSWGSNLRNIHFIPCIDNIPSGLVIKVAMEEFDEQKPTTELYLYWFVNGKKHRNGAPAVLLYDSSGSNIEYWQNGLCHQDDGAAVRHNNKRGRKKFYYIRGHIVDSKYKMPCPNCHDGYTHEPITAPVGGGQLGGTFDELIGYRSDLCKTCRGKGYLTKSQILETHDYDGEINTIKRC